MKRREGYTATHNYTNHNNPNNTFVTTSPWPNFPPVVSPIHQSFINKPLTETE